MPTETVEIPISGGSLMAAATEEEGFQSNLHERCTPCEWRFWEAMLGTYLAPEDVTSEEVAERNAEIKEQLDDLKNISLGGCVLLNIVLSAFYVTLRFLDDNSTNSAKVALGLQALFALLILLQFVSMLWHRWCMIMHVVATAKFQ
eukprot:comp22974_c0_seq1/m.36532 comp22974_c0_seq1/g.36532  ORF comp22974_c0_seq1/g.36532 comp22974_c0_seq1/m.36532 type:complete len:146 (-) comp22974_c0_seq1:47-484(-)